MKTSLIKINWKEHAQLCRLAYPMIASECVFGLDPFVNTLFAAKLGHLALAAQSLISLLFFTLSGVIWGILSSVCILISHHFGAKQYAEIRQIFHAGFVLALLLAFFSGIILWYAPFVFLRLHENLQVVTLSIGYAHVLPFTILGVAVYVVFAEFLIATSKTKFILLLSIIETPFNILFKYLFVFGKGGFPALGLAGLGWALGIVIWGTIILMILYVLFHKNQRHIQLLKLQKLKISYLKKLFLLGMLTGLDYLSQNGFFLIIALLMGCISSMVLAANQIVFQFLLFFIIVIWGGLGQTTMSRTGQMLGAGRERYIKVVVISGMQHALFLILPIMILFIFYPEWLIGLDLNIHDPNNLFILSLSKQFMKIASIYLLFNCTNAMTEAALRAHQDTYSPLKINFIGFWLIGVTVGYLCAFPLHLGAYGLWIGVVTGALASSVMMMRKFLKISY
jgi:MATE family multidrug resistance protein